MRSSFGQLSATQRLHALNWIHWWCCCRCHFCCDHWFGICFCSNDEILTIFVYFSLYLRIKSDFHRWIASTTLNSFESLILVVALRKVNTLCSKSHVSGVWCVRLRNQKTIINNLINLRLERSKDRKIDHPPSAMFFCIAKWFRWVFCLFWLIIAYFEIEKERKRRPTKPEHLDMGIFRFTLQFYAFSYETEPSRKEERKAIKK